MKIANGCHFRQEILLSMAAVLQNSFYSCLSLLFRMPLYTIPNPPFPNLLATLKSPVAALSSFNRNFYGAVEL
ncbi:hypothetical protein SLA2020_128460 [Shorea laevis]